MSPVTLIDAPLRRDIMRCPLPSFLLFHQHLRQPPILVSGHHRIKGTQTCIIGSKTPPPTPSVLLQAVTRDCSFQFQLKPSNIRPASPPCGGISKTLSPTLSRQTPARFSLRKSQAAMSPSSTSQTPTESSRTPKSSSHHTPLKVHPKSSITVTPKAKSPSSETNSTTEVSPSSTKQNDTGTSPPRRSPSSKAGAAPAWFSSHDDGSTPIHACCRRSSADDAGRRCSWRCKVGENHRHY